MHEHFCVCGEKMIVVNSFGKVYHRCTKCDKISSVTYNNGRDIGIPADEKVGKMRNTAHYYFDLMWQSRGWSKHNAYVWLQNNMNINKKMCHIGMFGIKECNKVIQICKEELDRLGLSGGKKSCRM